MSKKSVFLWTYTCFVRTYQILWRNDISAALYKKTKSLLWKHIFEISFWSLDLSFSQSRKNIISSWNFPRMLKTCLCSSHIFFRFFKYDLLFCSNSNLWDSSHLWPLLIQCKAWQWRHDHETNVANMANVTRHGENESTSVNGGNEGREATCMWTFLCVGDALCLCFNFNLTCGFEVEFDMLPSMCEVYISHSSYFCSMHTRTTILWCACWTPALF